MLYDLATAVMRFITRELSPLSSGPRGVHLNADELSEYMLRDLGLLDGRSRQDESPVFTDDNSGRLDQFILLPRAS